MDEHVVSLRIQDVELVKELFQGVDVPVMLEILVKYEGKQDTMVWDY